MKFEFKIETDEERGLVWVFTNGDFVKKFIIDSDYGFMITSALEKSYKRYKEE